MRLSEFIRNHAEEILREWDEFASTVIHAGKPLDKAALRDHAAQILLVIAADLEEDQSAADQVTKSRGEAIRDPADGDTAAETHADTRMNDGFAIDAMITEYRALRASVLRLWARNRTEAAARGEIEQLTRFNEAIDQAIAESVSRYTDQVDKAANLFMGVLGHDLRNPLNTIQLSAELLLRSGKDSGATAQPILNSAKRIQGLIDLMVDFSRAQSTGAMPLQRVPGNLEALFRGVIAETNVRHADRQLILNASGDFAGNWDERRMGQLLSNLLENAVLYGARGRDITVTMSSDASEVSFAVHNEGRPIPQDDIDRIFEAAHRGEGDEHRAPNGLGLGLYICREIVRAHRGRIKVVSDSASGTDFVVTLPRKS